MDLLGKASLDLDYMESLSKQNSALHRIDPRAKIIATFVFLITVVSVNRYDIAELLPFFLFPAITIRMANLPAGYLLKRASLTLPFIIMIGIFNPLFDKVPLLTIGDLTFTGGWLSFISIILRGFLTVLAALTLVASTGYHQICIALRQLGIPTVFTDQLLFLYRYLFVLLDEAAHLVRARAQRSFGHKGLGLHSWGPMIGHLLLRTLDRAHRIHLALLARGYAGQLHSQGSHSFSSRDLLYILIWISVFLLFRFTNPSVLLGQGVEKLLS